MNMMIMGMKMMMAMMMMTVWCVCVVARYKATGQMEKQVLLSDSDAAWKELRHLHISEAITSVDSFCCCCNVAAVTDGVAAVVASDAAHVAAAASSAAVAGKRNGKDIQRISCLRFNPRWMIPFCLMVDIAVRKLFYADCILVTLLKKIHFCLLKGEEWLICIPCDKLLTKEHIFTNCVDLQECRFFFETLVLYSCSVSVLRTTLSNFKNVQI